MLFITQVNAQRHHHTQANLDGLRWFDKEDAMDRCKWRKVIKEARWCGWVRGADLHMAQLMPLPLTVSCFSKIHIGFTFLVPAHPGSPGKRAVKRVCVCVSLNVLSMLARRLLRSGLPALGVLFSWAWSYRVWTALFSTHQFLAVLKHAAEHRAQLMKVRPSLHAELEKLLLVCQQATALPALSQSANSFPPLSRRRDAG